MSEVLKKVYVEVAADEFTLGYKKQSTSRISVLTGLTRKEVQKLRRQKGLNDEDIVARHNRAAKVTTGWLRDAEYSDENGDPAVLEIEKGKVSFQALVKKYGGDVPHRAMLDELLRVGSIDVLSDEKVKLKMRGFVPANGESEKYSIMGMDVADLINTIDHNVEKPAEESRLQLKVCYNNLPEEVLPRLKQLAANKGQQFLEDLDQWLSSHDRNVNPKVKGKGRKRAGIGLFYFEEDYDESEEEES